MPVQAKKGRKGDKFIAHLTPGEIVVPRLFAEDDDFRAAIEVFFKDNDATLEDFTVGSGKNKVNPETGYMEFAPVLAGKMTTNRENTYDLKDFLGE